MLALICAAPTPAADVRAQDGAEEQRLRAIERDLKAGAAEQAELQRRQEATARELEALRATMVRLADDIQGQEYSLSVLESRIGGLERDEVRLKEALGLRDEQMQRVALALQRLALRPGEAVALSPLKPDDAVRTAILLRAAVPAVRQSAETLGRDLNELFRVRAALTEQREQVALATAGLIDKRREMEKLTADKTALQATLAARREETAARVERLGREARDLKELVDRLAAERAAAAARAAAAEREAAAKAAAGRIVLKPPPGVEPAPAGERQIAALPGAAAPGAPPKPADLRPFSQARGTMPFPAVGTLKRRYGEGSDAPGALSRGIVIAARGGGQVVAPFDGVVAFAGPFRGYGLLLIIEHSEGYHTLLAGLGRIDCVLDQRVFAGEPVGVMAGGDAAELYVELRQNGQPVNPLPWLASRTGKSSG